MALLGEYEVNMQRDPQFLARAVRRTSVLAVFLRHYLYYGLILVPTLAVYISMPRKHELYALVVGAFAFFLVQVLFPAIRLDFSNWLTPKNLAIAIFLMQMIITPLLVAIFGATQSVLPSIPNDYSMNIALLLQILGFLSFSFGYQLRSWASQCVKSVSVPVNYSKGVWTSRAVIIIYVILGIIGFKFRFGGIHDFLLYISNPFNRLLRYERPTSAISFLGNLLRPFLGFAVTMAWCRWLDGNSRCVPRFIAFMTTIIYLITLALINLDYNRASMFVPILSSVAVYSLQKDRLTLRTLIPLFLTIITSAFSFGAYRAGRLSSGGLGFADILANAEFIKNLQIYFGGPQFLAFLLESTGFGTKLYWGLTLVGSVFHPIPVVGKAFRDFSGPTIFNAWIYGRWGAHDQIIPNIGELMMNFHIFGIIVGYFILGRLVWYLQRKFISTVGGPSIVSYCWFIVSYWCLQLIGGGNLAILSQIAFYALWPIYLLFIVDYLRRRL